ncbi:MAG TPA: YidC/Oxa1 family membrane protein insertase [Patescibacteria group bacterium]|nr:YidC/Oxa1 family membrane protein insertase [Patescibacteria group bacterium]
MFTTLIIQPIFNMLVLVYAFLPGHNFGVAIIVFTVLVRLLMWPLVKKQLHQAKAMRELQPELKRIKAQTKGDRQKESVMVMELYKERGINPFASLGLVLLQLPIFIALYSCLRRIVNDPHTLITFSYSWVQNLPWMKTLAQDITKFDSTLFGFIKLTEPALKKGQGIYWPAMLIVIGSAIAQYFQSKQLLPDNADSRGLRKILKDAGSGKQADQGEVNAAVGRSTRYFLPVLIFFITVGLPAALPLYWLTSGVVAYIQQARVLGKDETELEAVADKPSKKQVIEGEVIPPKKKAKKAKKGKAGHKRKRR